MVHKLDRIAIFDFDVHSGNGTADIVRRDPKHFMLAQFYAKFDFIEDEKKHAAHSTSVAAEGANDDETPPEPGSNIHSFQLSQRNQSEKMHKGVAELLRKMREFKPQLLLVSAGFDAYVRANLAARSFRCRRSPPMRAVTTTITR